MITGINHVTLSVRDLNRSFEFYENILGFKPLMRNSRGAYFLAGSLWFCLDLDPQTRSGPLPEYTHLAFSVAQKDFEVICGKITSSSTKLWKDNVSEGDSLYFLDPDGHKLEIHVGDWQSRLADTKENPWEEGLEFFDERD